MGLNIKVVGAGPAGLYFAYLMKKSFPDYRVRVVEQNPADATYGFGVVFSGRALSFLGQGDAAVIERLKANMESWSDQHITHKGQRVVIDGNSFSAIARLTMLKELQAICREAGVELSFGQRVEPDGLEADCDVLVAADGANSALRDRYADEFGTQTVELKNYFAWYGVETPYDAHTLTFIGNEGGTYCGHHYRYTPRMSTMVAEVDAKTWSTSGMADMSDEERKMHFEQTFRDTLNGKPLISNRSMWRRWRLVKNGNWRHKNIVLIGDAQRTAHPSIGSGTRLAMEDAIVLWRAFTDKGTDVEAAFGQYESERRPVRDKLNAAAEKSIAWYEDIAEKMALSPYELALDYMLRTGLMTPDRLARESPRFMAKLAEEGTIPADTHG
ncbi:2-polyprenyl-6-methoxyphenol hydroxylase [Noviherbaspirillum humi]|uniref:2-polyprenyl-6-methoxyphenol hydroxylase n=1 Tax=Noviherbaspirillum humi TaxID=1688639 RepID=A0A239JUL4_9BURK|nr:FAD-dependent monooxygenase [Noviherbaspirillum humi]SNT09597.1 2-polyprenyl-6-methoxyphenol hydroxylase [Noviherbaspirillum humi]